MIKPPAFSVGALRRALFLCSKWMLVPAGVTGGLIMSAQAAPYSGLPSAGSLGNTLPSSSSAIPQQRAGASLVIPELASPSTATVGGGSVVLGKVVLEGTEAVPGLSVDALQRIAETYLNKPQTFADLQRMAQAMTRECRAQGLALAQVVLPPQTVSQGVLRVRVWPGVFDTPTIRNSSELSTSVVERIVSATTPSGDVVNRRSLERAALLLGDIPGIRPAAIVMRPGTLPGSTAMDITVSPGQRMGGYVGLDNAGVDSTGRSRVMAGIQANELLGQGDQLKVDVLDAYENSNLLNGGIDYSLLVGGYGTRAGVSWSHLNYRYYLQGLKFDGDSDNVGAYVQHPWVRTPSTRIDVRLDAGVQMMTDRYPSLFALIAGGNSARKEVTSGSLSVSGSSAWLAGGLSTFNLQGTLGNLSVKNDAARFWSSSDLLDSAGSFGRLNYQATHEQYLIGPLSLQGSVNGQFASKNLDSSQKLLTGGAVGVRAYAAGSGAVDDGVVASLEFRSQWTLPVLPVLGGEHQVTLAGFYDQSWGQQYHNNTGLTSQNQVELAGGGAYVKVARNDDYALMLTWAHRTGDKDPVSGLSDRDLFWVSAVKSF
ncbi:ShlB/FhaC/HecB family hemolysin secretion/activation protein [Citrobacter meridianamericanus]|uniref:ShlB/FhaC/HecB family hemolysin secretion/activation protein n=1 Tax=Citrobacter meridianamericanus TaxID=2894201 RepID=UPI0039BE0945